jgi:hypothetical protein
LPDPFSCLNDDEQTGFDELPVNSLDRSDRKFLAAALVSGATVINAIKVQ